MKCRNCNADLPDNSRFCSVCGAQQGTTPQVPAPPQNGQFPVYQKSRTAYRLLAFFFGGLGIHNFYAGYVTRGIIQLVLTLTGVFAIVSCIWAFIEIFVVDRDAQGMPMKPGGCGCLLLVALLPLLLTIISGMVLLPSLQTARESARRSYCLSSLKQIGLAVQQYALDNKGHFPADMRTLKENDYLSDPDCYICPSSSEQPSCGSSFATNYIYFGRGITLDVADIPIAMDAPRNHHIFYKNPRNYRNFVNILYSDGHARGWGLPRDMSSCVEILNELHSGLADSEAGRIVLENARKADMAL